jgi:hypothetical protein
MGFYINPANKHIWLEENAQRVHLDFLYEAIPVGVVPVILIDNGMFYAAGIGYDKKEYEYMSSMVGDNREKKLYLVDQEHILKLAENDQEVKEAIVRLKKSGRLKD